MENNEEFKRVVANIKELDQQLMKVDDKQLEQQGIKVNYLRVNMCLLPKFCIIIYFILIKTRSCRRETNQGTLCTVCECSCC
jgi:hypothetical protein